MNEEYVKNASGLFVPENIKSVTEQPNRQARRQIMKQVRRYNRQEASKLARKKEK